SWHSALQNFFGPLRRLVIKSPHRWHLSTGAPSPPIFSRRLLVEVHPHGFQQYLRLRSDLNDFPHLAHCSSFASRILYQSPFCTSLQFRMARRADTHQVGPLEPQVRSLDDWHDVMHLGRRSDHALTLAL